MRAVRRAAGRSGARLDRLALLVAWAGRLPLLFALDAALAIPGGCRFVPDCRLLGNDRGDTHCGDSFGCGSSCASSGGSDGDGGSDGSCGSGCGGD